MDRGERTRGASRSSGWRVGAIACALLLLLVAFQALTAEASPPTGFGEYNHALASHGGTATASTFASSYPASRANDGSTTTYWRSADRVGWLAVRFGSPAIINEIHVHFRTTVYPKLSLYYDTNADGSYELSEKVWTTTANTRLDVSIATASARAAGIKITIDARVGSGQPRIAELEAYLRGDTDGDGLTNADEAGVTYYEDMRAADLPREIPNAGQDTVLLYNMGTTTADGKIEDLSSKANDGALSGTQAVAGKLGGARSFNGIGDHLTLPFSDSLGNQRFTVAAWAYPTAQNGGAIWDSGGRQEAPQKGYNLHMDPGTNRWRGQAFPLATATPWSNVDSVTPVALNTWTHVAFTWDGTFLRLYVNGNLDNSVAASGNVSHSTSSPSFVGRLSDNFRFWQGRIDELQVWRRALSASEVTAQFQKTAPVLYYDMESLRSASLQDLAGNGNIGTPTGTSISEGRLGSALQFNGASSFVLPSNPTVGFPKDSLTLAAWVKRAGAGVVFDEQGSAAPNSWWHDSQMEILADGTVRMSVWPRTVSLSCGSIDTNWHHLALTYDRPSGALACFVDGTRRATGTMSRDSSGASTYVIGRADTTNLGYGGAFNGIIDEVQVWNVALAESKIRDSVRLNTLEHPLDVTLARFYGVSPRALVNFTVDHPSKRDLTGSVGYWDGSGWVDRIVWDPGRHVSSGPPGEAPSGNIGTPSTALAALGILGTDWAPGEVDSGTRASVVVDLVASPGSASAVEIAAGILRPAFPASSFFSDLRWRLIVRDWTANGAGDVVDFTLRLEAKSDPGLVDTDGDGLTDYDERAQVGTLPVTRDSEVDGLEDRYELQPHDLTLSIDGVTSVVPGLTTDPRNSDTDADGLTDGQERGVVASGFVTNPRAADSDGDTLVDGEEVYTHRTKPTSRESDGDTIPDDLELIPTPLSLTINGGAQTRMIATSPAHADTDADGLRDDQEKAGTTPWGVVTDPTVSDTDGDGLVDGSESYIREFAMNGRAPLGTWGSRSIDAFAVGPVHSVEVRYATSGSEISGIHVRIDHNGVIGPWIRSGGGTGFYLDESREITGVFPSQPMPGSYTLTVSAPAGNVVLEEFSILFKIRTVPTRTDTDGDSIADKEEVEAGRDGWVTDPNRVDSDDDGWWDNYEVSRGTNPLLADTDQDGVRDPADIDPLRNLLVAITIERIHHGNLYGATGSPTLMGVIRVNDDYTYATQHRQASEESVCTFWVPIPWPPWTYCTTSVWSTGVFFLTYYADVPDNIWDVRIRILASDIDIFTGDDPLVPRSITYRLRSSFSEKAWSSDGLHWITYRVSTMDIGKVRTLAVTDDEAIVSDQFGTPRYKAPERFAVLLLDATNSYGTIGTGMNAILVPESLFVRSNLKARLANGVVAPLGDATFYDGDVSRGTMSEAVAALIAGTLNGYDAWSVLEYALHDNQGTRVFRVVDVTGRVFGLNVPADVVRIIPWSPLYNGPTGSLPQDFWQKLGAAGTTVLNSIVYVGQLIYGGLIAIGTFIFYDLPRAIVSWGMRFFGYLRDRYDDVQRAIERAGQVLQKALDWAVQWITGFIHTVLDVLVGTLVAFLGDWVRDVYNCAIDGFRRLHDGGTLDANSVVLCVMDAAMTGVNVIVAILTAAKLVEIALSYVLGVGLVVGAIASEVFRAVVVSAFTTAAFVGTAVIAEDIKSGKRDPEGALAPLVPLEPFREIGTAAFTFILHLWDTQKTTRLPFAMRATGVAFSLLGLALAVGGEALNLTGFNLLVLDVVSLAVAAGGLILYLAAAAGLAEVISNTLSSLARFTNFLEGVLSVLGVAGSFFEIVNHVAGGKY